MGDQDTLFTLPPECDWSRKCGRYLNDHMKVLRPNSSEIFLEIVSAQTKHHLKNPAINNYQLLKFNFETKIKKTLLWLNQMESLITAKKALDKGLKRKEKDQIQASRQDMVATESCRRGQIWH